MDLEQTLETMRKEIGAAQKVKIGAKHGTGWFYCGTVKRFLENIGPYDAEIRSYWQKRLSAAWEKLGQTAQNRPDVELVERLRTWSKTIIMLCDRVDRIRGINRDYVGIAEREVLTVRHADKSIDENTINIIIDGYEEGKFWTFDEARRARKYLSMREAEEDEE